MKPSKIYKKAAKRIFKRKSHFACEAICEAKGLEYGIDTDPEEIETFEKLFKENNGIAWMCSPEHSGEQNREHRIIVLLLMAEMSKEDWF